MNRVALAALGIAATMAFVPLASADPTPGHSTIVTTQSPPMLCEIGSDDSDAGVGPNVVCQGVFPESPMDPMPWPGWKGDPLALHQDQAVVTASGRFSYRDANIGVGYPEFHPDTLFNNQTYHLQGWTIAASDEGITFTNDATGHGMVVGSDQNVNPF